MAATITKKERFEDIDPKDNEGRHEYYYCGYNYEVAIETRNFRVRIYDNELGSATVISPANARTWPETRALVDFLIESFGCKRILFYFGSTGTYQVIDLVTLEFIKR